MRWLAVGVALVPMLWAQRWQDTVGRTRAGLVERQQAVLDVGTDTKVLLVASHPDDRYVLLATWLRFRYGARVAVLLATRGGGGQNSIGGETGDALERIRTLETEAGCARFDAEVWYLNRPDGGYRRSAAETFAEWGRQATLLEMVRLIRLAKPDVVATTHHEAESHGHDRALVELLPEAVGMAGDPAVQIDGAPPHKVLSLAVGADRAEGADLVTVPIDVLEPNRGKTLRRLAYEVLEEAHLSPGAPAPMATIFDPEIRLRPLSLAPDPTPDRPFGRLPGIFDPGVWPADAEAGARLRELLERRLPELASQAAADPRPFVEALERLRQLLASTPPGEFQVRAARRIEALERLLMQWFGLQIEVTVPAGTVAVPGEEFDATVHLHAPPDLPLQLAASGSKGVTVELESFDGRDLAVPQRGQVRAHASIRMPGRSAAGLDPVQERFQSVRFLPAVELSFRVGVAGTHLQTAVVLPVEERPPLDVAVVPRMLLLPAGRKSLQFSVSVRRNTRFPLEDELEVRAPAGYVVEEDRRKVSLRDQRSDLFSFRLQPGDDRRAGVDVLRIGLGNAKVLLPVHKVDVQIPASLRIGLVRGRDDTLPSLLGVGGLGLAWSELSDQDVAIGDLSPHDTIVVDVRALRDRPGVRHGFRRLLEFAALPGRRLVVLYQKDVEFHQPGEAFLGAPTAPFQIGRGRVTRPDAPVRLLVPEHVLLNHPNRILPSDWDGWEQERGLYFPSVYGPAYREILEMGDPGQPPERGSLLHATTGQGEYVYCALSLWRQLKKLHPGAVRLLANLLTPAPR